MVAPCSANGAQIRAGVPARSRPKSSSRIAVNSSATLLCVAQRGGALAGLAGMSEASASPRVIAEANSLAASAASTGQRNAGDRGGGSSDFMRRRSETNQEALLRGVWILRRILNAVDHRIESPFNQAAAPGAAFG